MSVTLLLPCLILLSQCQENKRVTSFLPPITGEWYGPGDSISFIRDSGNGAGYTNPVSCSLEQNGRILYRDEFTEYGMISLPIPPESQSGIINVVCQSPGNEEDIRFFQVYYLEEPPGTLSLSYYPPLPMAGSIVEVSCRAEKTTGDTWFRWYLEDKLMGEGFLKDGKDRILFYGPGKKGNYTLMVEVYPAKPVSPEKGSPYSVGVELFINDIADQDGTLNPENWQSLFYCDGTHIDRGRPFLDRGSKRALGYLASQNLSPQIVEGDRGYGFTSNSYLTYDGKLLQGPGSALALIQTRMVLYPTRGADGGEGTLQIFNSSDGRGNNSYSLFLKEGRLLFSLGQNAEFARSHLDFPSTLDGVPFWLSLVIEQREDDLLIRWYLDSILIKEDRLRSFLLSQVTVGGGSTTWGRGNYPSFEGILLEWAFNGEPGEVKKIEEEMNHDFR